MSEKKRRNNEAINEAILDATKELIESRGFFKIALTQIVLKAEISPNMFYKRYSDLDKLLWEFVRNYDYWFTNVIDVELDHSDLEIYYKKVLGHLSDALSGNKVMQELIKYELADDNPLTRRTAGVRELDTGSVMEELETFFKNSSIDIRACTALLIGGIYYLILHRDRSLFCGIDFNSKEGLERMNNTVNGICDKIFEIREIDSKISQIVRNLLKRGVDKTIIAESTGLSLEEVVALQV